MNPNPNKETPEQELRQRAGSDELIEFMQSSGFKLTSSEQNTYGFWFNEKDQMTVGLVQAEYMFKLFATHYCSTDTNVGIKSEQELRTKILKEALVKSSVVRWEKNKGEPIKQSSQQIVEMPIDDLMDLIATHYKAREAETVRLELSNNQALHLWGMMVSFLHDTTNELKRAGVFTQKGELNKRLKYQYLSEIHQEQIDNLALSELIYKEIEKQADFSELSKESRS